MYRVRVATLGFVLLTLVTFSMFPDGDPVAGRQIYDRCIGCHSPERDRTGPRHCGLLGRVAGRVTGFDYSDVMRDSGIVWVAQTLDQFLASPLTYMPGTNMGFAGIKDPMRRRDLIAYLEQISVSPELCRHNP